MHRVPPLWKTLSMRRWLTLSTLLLAAALAGCGGDDRATAVEARETNTATLGDFRYRVTMFRQLNPRTPPDNAVYDAEVPPGKAVVAAFLRACNASDEPAAPTDDIHLENAFGKTYTPVALSDDNPFSYDAEPVGDGDCRPSDGSAADQALPGSALVFEVPLADLRERPFVLEIADGTGERRIKLDL